MWPLISSNRAIDMPRLEILDLDVKSPLIKPESCSTNATVAAQHARLLASAKTWRCTALVSAMPVTILLGTVMFFSCLVQLSHWFLSISDTSVFHPFFSSHASRYIRFPSAVVGEIIPRGSYILPRWLRMALFVTGCLSLNCCTGNSSVSFRLSQLCPSILPGLAMSSLSSSGRLDSHLWTGNLAFSNISVASFLNCFRPVTCLHQVVDIGILSQCLCCVLELLFVLIIVVVENRTQNEWT